MSFVRKKINQIKTFRAKLPRIGVDAAMSNENKIIKYYQIYQVGSNLKAGVRKDAVKIGWYAEGTQQKWIESEDYDPELDKSFRNEYYMYWSGSFFRNMQMYRVGNKEYAIVSTSESARDLERKHGDIYTLTNETKKNVEKLYIAPYIDKKVSEFLRSLG